MRRAALSTALLLALAGPTALAFFAGGYFDEARTWAGVAAWAAVVLAVIGGAPMPQRRALLPIGALALLAIWTLLSINWAPIAGNAYHAGQIVVLYAGVLLGTSMLLRGRAVRWVEPGLAAGALIVIGYGMSERLLPGLLHFARSASAQGRLEQPLTYWNAMGELAAIGLVLCARLAGDSVRAARLRIPAAAASGILGMGLYVSFSRGALFACAAGLVALVIASGRREQLTATLSCAFAAALGAVAAAPFAAVASLQGTTSARESQGAIVLALLIVITLAAAAGQWWLIRRERAGRLRLVRRAPLWAAAGICAGLAIAIVLGAKENSTAPQPLSGGATRLVTLQSNRYDYWDVALRAFGQQPVHGVGAGGWSVYWLRWRTVDEFAQDAHSLPLQVLAELGVVGLALLAAFLAGVALAASSALRVSSYAVGPVAGFVAYIAHAPLDWDWQMPAVTLIAMVLAGALLAIGQDPAAPERAEAGELAITSAR